MGSGDFISVIGGHITRFQASYTGAMDIRRILEALGGLPKVKMHCSVLAEEALKSALDDYYKKKGVPSPVKIPASSGHEHEMG